MVQFLKESRWRSQWIDEQSVELLPSQILLVPEARVQRIGEQMVAGRAEFDPTGKLAADPRANYCGQCQRVHNCYTGASLGKDL